MKRVWPCYVVAALCGTAALLSGCATALVTPARPLSDAAVPPVVAVSSFDDRSGFVGPWQLGSGMADLLVSELVTSRNFTVVEREHLATVVTEIERQKLKHFRSEGRVDDGRLKNARYLIRGVINDFSQVGGGSLAVAIRNVLFAGRGYRARVALTLTIVNVESGEIIDAVQCSAIARARQAYVKGAYKDVAFAGDTFFKTPMGVATVNAIRRGVRGIVKKMPHIMWEPMIAGLLSTQEVILNGGANRGFRTGVEYDVRDSGRVVTDPATGDRLAVIPGPVIGRIRVRQVEPTIAFADILIGSGLQRGQRLVPAGP